MQSDFCARHRIEKGDEVRMGTQVHGSLWEDFRQIYTIAEPGYVPPAAICSGRYLTPVWRDKESYLKLRVSIEQPQQTTQCSLLKIPTGFIGALRSSGKNVVNGQNYRCGLGAIVPVDRTHTSLIKEECLAPLLSGGEFSGVHIFVPSLAIGCPGGSTGFGDNVFLQ